MNRNCFPFKCVYTALCLLLLIGNMPVPALAQSPETWKETIIKYQASLQKLTQPKGNQQYFMRMHVSATPASGKAILKATNMEVRFWIRAQQLVYESDQLSVYRDANESITVVHPLKAISRSATGMEKPAPETVTEMGLLQEKILEKTTVVNVQGDTWKGRKVQRIVLRMDEEIGKKIGIRYVTYFYDESWKRVVRQQFDFLPGRSLVQQAIDLDELNFQDTQKLRKHASDYVFASQKILPQYRQYTLEGW